MAGLLSSLKRGNQDQAQASSAATAAYLLEWNQKFEKFMRAKVGELEARVAAQQARISTRAEEEERAWADELMHFDFEEVEESAANGDGVLLNDGAGVVAEEEEEVVEETSPDYIGMMGGGDGSSPAPVDTEGALGDDNGPLEASSEVMESAALPAPADTGAALEGGDTSDDGVTSLALGQIEQNADKAAAEFFAIELEDDFWAYEGDDDEPQPVLLLSDQDSLDTGLHPEGDNLEVEEEPVDEANLLPADTGLHPEDDNLEAWENKLPDQAPEDYKWVNLG